MVVLMNKIKSFINKYKFEIFITIFFACFYIFLTRFGKYYYGSTLDWNVQHYLIPDYFRKLFYKKIRQIQDRWRGLNDYKY